MITATELTSIGTTLSHVYHPELLKLAVSHHFSDKLVAHYAQQNRIDMESILQTLDSAMRARVRELGHDWADYVAARSGVTKAGDTVRYIEALPD